MKKNKKIVSILLTLAFMASFIIPSAAFAANSASITGAYKYVKAKNDQNAGTVTIASDDAFVAANVDNVYYEINLPAGVTIPDTTPATTDVAITNGGDYTVTDSGVSGTVASSDFASAIAVTFSTVDVASDVTGNVVAEVKAWGYKTGTGVVWEYNQNVTIAKVVTGNVTISAGTPEVVAVGANQTGAKLTVKEGTPGALAAGDNVIITILTSGVKFDTLDTAASYVDTNIGANTAFSGEDKVLRVTIATESDAAAGKIECTPVFKINPGVTGDIKVKISGDVTTTEAVVASVGQGSVKVTLENNDTTAYLGQQTTLDVAITLDPQTELKADDYFTVTLPKGFTWAGAVSSSANVTLEDATLDSDRTAWFAIGTDESANVILDDLSIKADYNAPVGDIKATVAGAVKGEIVIGKAAAPVSITTNKVNVPLKGNNVAAGDITITEADGGVIPASATLDLALPMGVTFAKLPTVEVTEGDLTLDASEVEFVGTDKSTIQININTVSNIASTIKISDILYNIDNRASLGDVQIAVAKSLNSVSDNALANVSNATIVSDTAAKSTFVIGSTSFTVNGVTKTLDAAPYIKNDRTFLPVRFVANAVGVSDENILWNAADQSVVIIKGDRVVKLAIGSTTLFVNGVAVQMDTAPEISNGRTMLPVRWVAQALGASINWDAATQTVTVDVK